MAKIITAPEEYELEKGEISVFLAGGITNCPNWQDQLIKAAKERYTDSFTDKLVLFNPRRKEFPTEDPTAGYKQIEWEFEQIEKADIFSMYFTASESDQPICMYELGRNIIRMQNRFPNDWKDRIIISVEDGYKRRQDVLIQTDLATNGTLYVDTRITNGLLAYHLERIMQSYIKIEWR